MTNPPQPRHPGESLTESLTKAYAAVQHDYRYSGFT